MISISCLESKLLNNNNWYGRFQLAPFQKGEGLTVANALRRTLLAEKSNFFITWVDFYNAEIPYSVLTGMRESVFDILLNLKQVIFTSDKIVPNRNYFLKSSSIKNFRTQKEVASRVKLFSHLPLPKKKSRGATFNFESTPAGINFLNLKKHDLNIAPNNIINQPMQKKQDSAPRDFIVEQDTHHEISKRLTSSSFLMEKGSLRRPKNLLNPPFQESSYGVLPIKKIRCSDPPDKKNSLANFKNRKNFSKNVFCKNQILGKTSNSTNGTSTWGILSKSISVEDQFLHTSNLKSGDSTCLGYICAKGPTIIYAKNIKLPKGLKCVDPDKYLVTLADDGLFYLRFALTTEIKTLPLADSSNLPISINQGIKFNNVRLEILPKVLFNKEIDLSSSFPITEAILNRQKKKSNHQSLDNSQTDSLTISNSMVSPSLKSQEVAAREKPNHYQQEYCNLKGSVVSPILNHFELNSPKPKSPLLYFNQFTEKKSRLADKRKVPFLSHLKSYDSQIRKLNYTKSLISEQHLLLTNDSIKQFNFQNTSIIANIQKTCLLNIQVKHYYYKCGRFDRFLFDLIKPFKPVLKSTYSNKCYSPHEMGFPLSTSCNPLGEKKENIFFQGNALKILTRGATPSFNKIFKPVAVIGQKFNSQLYIDDKFCKQVNSKTQQIKLPIFRKYRLFKLFNSRGATPYLLKWQKIFKSTKTNSIYNYLKKLSMSQTSSISFLPYKPYKEKENRDTGGNQISLLNLKLSPASVFKNIFNINTFLFLNLSHNTEKLFYFVGPWTRMSTLFDHREGTRLYIEKFLTICPSFQCCKNNILWFLKFYVLKSNNSLDFVNKNSVLKKNTRAFPFVRPNRLFLKTQSVFSTGKFRKLLFWMNEKTQRHDYHLRQFYCSDFHIFDTKTRAGSLFESFQNKQKLLLQGSKNFSRSFLLSNSKHFTISETMEWRPKKQWFMEKKIDHREEAGVFSSINNLKAATSFVNTSGYMLAYDLRSQNLGLINQPRISLDKYGSFNRFSASAKLRSKPSNFIRQISYKPVWLISYVFSQNTNKSLFWLDDLNWRRFIHTPINKNRFLDRFYFAKESRKNTFNSITNNTVVLKPIYLNVEQIIYILKQTTKFHKNQRINPLFFHSITKTAERSLYNTNSLPSRYYLKSSKLSNSLYHFLSPQKPKRGWKWKSHFAPRFKKAVNLSTACIFRWITATDFKHNPEYVWPKADKKNKHPLTRWWNKIPWQTYKQINGNRTPELYIDKLVNPSFFMAKNNPYGLKKDKSLLRGNKQTTYSYLKFVKLESYKTHRLACNLTTTPLSSTGKHGIHRPTVFYTSIFGSNFIFKNDLLFFTRGLQEIVRGASISGFKRFMSHSVTEWKPKSNDLYNEPYNINIANSKISFNLRYTYPFKYTIFETFLPFINFSEKICYPPKNPRRGGRFARKEGYLFSSQPFAEILGLKNQNLYKGGKTNAALYAPEKKVQDPAPRAMYQHKEIIPPCGTFNSTMISHFNFDFIQYNESFKIYTTLPYTCLKTYESDLPKYDNFNKRNKKTFGASSNFTAGKKNYLLDKVLKINNSKASISREPISMEQIKINSLPNYGKLIQMLNTHRNYNLEPHSEIGFLLPTLCNPLGNNLESVAVIHQSTFDSTSKWRIINNSNFNDAFIIIPCIWPRKRRWWENLKTSSLKYPYFTLKYGRAVCLNLYEFISSRNRINRFYSFGPAPSVQNFSCIDYPFQKNNQIRFLNFFYRLHGEIIKNKLDWSRMTHINHKLTEFDFDHQKNRKFPVADKNYNRGVYESKKLPREASPFRVPKSKIPHNLASRGSIKKIAINFENIYYKHFLWNSLKITLRILNNAVLPLVANRKYSIPTFIPTGGKGLDIPAGAENKNKILARPDSITQNWLYNLSLTDGLSEIYPYQQPSFYSIQHKTFKTLAEGDFMCFKGKSGEKKSLQLLGGFNDLQKLQSYSFDSTNQWQKHQSTDFFLESFSPLHSKWKPIFNGSLRVFQTSSISLPIQPWHESRENDLAFRSSHAQVTTQNKKGSLRGQRENNERYLLSYNQMTPEKLAAFRRREWNQQLTQEPHRGEFSRVSTPYSEQNKEIRGCSAGNISDSTNLNVKSPLTSNLWSSSFYCSYSLYAISTQSDLFLQNLMNTSSLTNQIKDASLWTEEEQTTREANGNFTSSINKIKGNRDKPFFFKKISSEYEKDNTNQFLYLKPSIKYYEKTIQKILKSPQSLARSCKESSHLLPWDHKLVNSWVPRYDFNWQKTIHFAILDRLKRAKFNDKKTKTNPKKEMIAYNPLEDLYQNQPKSKGSLRGFFLQYQKKNIDDATQNSVFVLKNKYPAKRLKKYELDFGNRVRRPQGGNQLISEESLSISNIKLPVKLYQKSRTHGVTPLKFSQGRKPNPFILKSWKSILWTAEANTYFCFRYPVFIQNCNLPWLKLKSVLALPRERVFNIPNHWLNRITRNTKPLFIRTREVIPPFICFSKASPLDIHIQKRGDRIFNFLSPENTAAINRDRVLNDSLFRTYTQLASSSNKTHQHLLHTTPFKNLILPVAAPQVQMQIENKGSYATISYFTINEGLNSIYKVNYIVESHAESLGSPDNFSLNEEMGWNTKPTLALPREPVFQLESDFNHHNRLSSFNPKMENWRDTAREADLKKSSAGRDIQREFVTSDSLTVSNFLNTTYSFVPNKTILLSSFNESAERSLMNFSRKKLQVQNESEYIQIDIWTNGESSPRQALLNAFKKLFELFYNLSKYNCLKPIEI